MCVCTGTEPWKGCTYVGYVHEAASLGLNMGVYVKPSTHVYSPGLGDKGKRLRLLKFRRLKRAPAEEELRSLRRGYCTAGSGFLDLAEGPQGPETHMSEEGAPADWY